MTTEEKIQTYLEDECDVLKCVDCFKTFDLVLDRQGAHKFYGTVYCKECLIDSLRAEFDDE